MSLFAFDESFRAQGFNIIAGADESGRGCIAGPVVAACVCFKDNVFIEGINDSKQLTAEQREKTFEKILKHSFVGIGIIDVDLIEKFNILEATRLAMKEAFNDLLNSFKKDVELLLLDAITLPDLKVNQKSIIKGDQKSASIAAASIIAKVTRDRIMKQYHKIYPNYGFDKHKGYATQQHINALKKYGPCEIHRKSFSPVRELMLF